MVHPIILKKKLKMFYKESKNFLKKEEISFINNSILDNNFPWYYQPAATTDECPVYTHTIIHRYDIEKEKPNINSNIYPIFEEIVLRFCKKHKIKFNVFTRASVNSISFNKKEINVPHVDHDFKHKVLMIYLNDTEGDTIVFNKKYDDKNNLILSKKLPILRKINPEPYKIVCWDGDYYHAATYPKLKNRRVVFVSTFI